MHTILKSKAIPICIRVALFAVHFSYATGFAREYAVGADLSFLKAAEYGDKPAPFPETPEGQRQFLDEVNNLVLTTPNNHGKGIFWWEPATRRGGRRTVFDREGNALPVIRVFDKHTLF